VAVPEGEMRGLAVIPLHKEVPAIASFIEELYRMLSALDFIRIGQTREKKAALEFLHKKLKA
jgi:hypothetical protein